MSSLKVLGITYQKFYHPFTYPRLPIKDVFDILLDKLTVQMKSVIDILTPSEQELIGEHFLCSTIVTSCFANGDIKWDYLNEYFKTHMGQAYPEFFIIAYECASWGYSLRYFLKKYPKSRYVVITIFDVNVFNYEYWVYNKNWEHSGFGSTTMLLEISEGVSDELITGSAFSFNALMDFAKGIRRAVEKKKGRTLALPFFPKNIRLMFESVLQGNDLLPNDHPEWGHCFGNDPWLSILLHHKENTNFNYLASSFALNGYFCIADIEITDETKFLMIDENGK